MHVTVTTHLVLADHRHVVFNVARRHTRAATGAGREVDGHAPTVTYAFHRVALPQVKCRRLLAVARVNHAIAIHVFVDGEGVVLVPRSLALGLSGFREVAVERRFLHHAVTVHDRVVDLGGCKGVLRTRCLDVDVKSIVARHTVLHRGEPKNVSANRHWLAVCSLEVLAVFAGGKRRTSYVLSAVAAAVTEGDTEGAWRLTWLHEGGKFDRLAVHRHLHHRSLVTLGDVGVEAHGFHVCAGHGHVVVPCHLGHGVRRFLQHGVAGLVAGRYGLLLIEGQFQVASCRRGQTTNRRRHVDAEGRCSGRYVVARHVKSVVQGAVPLPVAVHGVAGVSRVVGGANHIVPCRGLTCPCHEALSRCAGVEQRLDGGLGQIDTGSTNAEVHPVFQPVVVRGHGRAACRCFIGHA